MITPTTMMTTTAMPMPIPALAPVDDFLFCKCIVGKANEEETKVESSRLRLRDREGAEAIVCALRGGECEVIRPAKYDKSERREGGGRSEQ